MIKVNDTVRLRGFEGTPNHRARVVALTDGGVYVSNTNMPFMGTFTHAFFTLSEVEVVTRAPEWDGAVVLKIGGWEGDRFVVDSDQVQGYIDSGEFVVRPFKYTE